MFKKIAVSLIVVGMIVVGHSLSGATPAQAAEQCGITGGPVLAANPELKTLCNPIVQGQDTGGDLSLAAEAARYTGLAEFYRVKNGSTFFATNPELSVVGRHVVEQDGITGDQLTVEAARYTGLAGFYRTKNGSTFFATNPELSVVGRHIVEQIGMTGDQLTVEAARYTGLAEFYRVKNGSTFFATNPELSVVGRRIVEQDGITGDQLAANPELKSFHRHMVEAN